MVSLIGTYREHGPARTVRAGLLSEVGNGKKEPGVFAPDLQKLDHWPDRQAAFVFFLRMYLGLGRSANLNDSPRPSISSSTNSMSSLTFSIR